MASIFIEPKDKEDYTAVLERLERAVMVGQKLTDPSIKRIFSRKEMDANRADLIENCIVLCQVCRKKGGLSRLSQAVRMINMAMDYNRQWKKKWFAGDLELQLAWCYWEIGEIYACNFRNSGNSADFEQTVDVWQKAIRLGKSIFRHGYVEDAQVFLAAWIEMLAEFYMEKREPSSEMQAAALYKKGLSVARKCCKNIPDDYNKEILANFYLNCGEVYRKLDNGKHTDKKARNCFQRALMLYRQLMKDNENENFFLNSFRCCRMLGELYMNQGQVKKGGKLYAQGLIYARAVQCCHTTAAKDCLLQALYLSGTHPLTVWEQKKADLTEAMALAENLFSETGDMIYYTGISQLKETMVWQEKKILEK